MQADKFEAIHRRLQDRLRKARDRPSALAALDQAAIECGNEPLQRDDRSFSLYRVLRGVGLVAIGASLIGMGLLFSGMNEGVLGFGLTFGGVLLFFAVISVANSGPAHQSTSFGLLLPLIQPIRYGLAPVLPPRLDIGVCRRRFPDFDRGCQGREIDQQWDASYVGAEHTFRYSAYRFRYVIGTKQKRSDGTYRTDYSTHHRHGLIVPCPFAATLRVDTVDSSDAVSNFLHGPREFHDGLVGWKSASAAFESRFRVRASSEQVAARYLTPVLVEGLLGLPMRNVSLELCPDGEACLSFSDGDWLEAAGAISDHMAEPARLAAEIRKEESIPKLDAALEFLHLCRKYTDDNFRAAPSMPANVPLRASV